MKKKHNFAPFGLYLNKLLGALKGLRPQTKNFKQSSFAYISQTNSAPFVKPILR